jgi:hypothetical protein
LHDFMPETRGRFEEAKNAYRAALQLEDLPLARGALARLENPKPPQPKADGGAKSAASPAAPTGAAAAR